MAVEDIHVEDGHIFGPSIDHAGWMPLRMAVLESGTNRTRIACAVNRRNRNQRTGWKCGVRAIRRVSHTFQNASVCSGIVQIEGKNENQETKQ